MIYSINGMHANSMREVRRIYDALSEEDKIAVVEAALDWADTCNDTLACCMVDDHGGSCGLKWVEFILSDMESRLGPWEQMGDETLGVRKEKRYKIYATVELTVDADAVGDDDVKELVEDHSIPIKYGNSTIRVSKVEEVGE